MTTPLSRLSDWFWRNLPTREQMEQNRYVPRSALRTELWRFTRRSVPRAIALGIVVGVLVPIAQIVFAAILCMPVRANVPLAALTTFVTNPFTTPLIWVFAYKVGRAILQIDAVAAIGPIDSLMAVSDFAGFMHWLSDEGKVLVFGLFVVAAVAGATGYLLASFSWRWWIARKRRQDLRR